MFRSLYSKLAVVILVLFTLLGILMIVVVFFATDLYRQEVNQKLNIHLAENIVKEKILIQDGKIDRNALEYIFHILMVINPSIELYLLDPEGNILEFSAAPGKVKRDKVSLSPIKKWLSGNLTVPLLGDDPRNLNRQKVFSAAPIYQQGKLEGYLYVILGGEQYDTISHKIQNSFILRVSSWLVIAAILFAGIIGLLIFSLLTRRLRKLAAGMHAFKQGEHLANVDFPLDRQSILPGDEIDNLTLAFREMANRIEEQIGMLQKSDLMRRELVANVSHDLRTPLATLTAYVETLQLKESRLSATERQKYLNVVRKHCDRLGSLVEDLFELARLDANETQLNHEPFSIAELIQDVVQNYELSAKEKNITLTSNIGNNHSFVMGDIALVERVLENLLINSLRHTPKGGTIRVILTPSEEFMNVAVLDTGVGIPDEALPHVFDRFYKVDDKNSRSTPFTGLGLAIAKRIMDLHGTGIEVESEPNVGTCFTFSFPINSIS
jgi:signal transduction histidine kinase